MRRKHFKKASVFQGKTPYDLANELKLGQYSEVMKYLKVRTVLNNKFLHYASIK